jgi:hypothetical protein
MNKQIIIYFGTKKKNILVKKIVEIIFFNLTNKYFEYRNILSRNKTTSQGMKSKKKRILKRVKGKEKRV